ncbi:MAG: hypothetical protein K2M54_11130 [Muribaculaceae bacterium]|nr:hypothetical protein [Muribaculaceae bacterium]
MSDILASGAIFFDKKTKRQIVGVDNFVFMSDVGRLATYGRSAAKE